jgi:hypothetical protein
MDQRNPQIPKVLTGQFFRRLLSMSHQCIDLAHSYVSSSQFSGGCNPLQTGSACPYICRFRCPGNDWRTIQANKQQPETVLGRRCPPGQQIAGTRRRNWMGFLGQNPARQPLRFPVLLAWINATPLMHRLTWCNSTTTGIQLSKWQPDLFGCHHTSTHTNTRIDRESGE